MRLAPFQRRCRARQGFREDRLDHTGDFGLGAARGIGEWREGDDEGSGGEIGRRRPAIGDGEQDGSLDEKLERFAFALLTVGDTDAAGEAAEGVGELRGKAGDVIEGEDPVEAGEGEEFAGAGRKRGEGRSGGIERECGGRGRRRTCRSRKGRGG